MTERIWAREVPVKVVCHGEYDLDADSGGEPYVHERLYTAQQETIAALVEAAQAVVDDAQRLDLHGNGALNDAVTPYRINDLSAALARAKDQA